MLNLYTIATKNVSSEGSSLTNGEKFSVVYHSLFDYPLDFADLIRWRAAEEVANEVEPEIISKDNYFLVESKEGLIYKRILRRRISQKKLLIARKAALVLSFIPLIKMIAVTGSLAMENASDESDIDLMIVAARNLMWTTRALSYLALRIVNYAVRKAGDREQRDKLCLNIWFDEGDLIWRSPRNLYTAHEIAQIKPLVDRDETYEKFLGKNKWILKYWPNSVKIKNSSAKRVTQLKIQNSRVRTGILEKIAYRLQYFYMKKKITRELVTPTRALFHPQDWGRVVLDRLKSFS